MERFWSLWRALALLTYPFAMQCHMAVLPFSFMGSLFLVMLSLMVRLFARGRVPFQGEPAVKAEEAAMGREAEAGETAGRVAAEVEGSVIDNPVKRRWQVIVHLAPAVVCAGMFTLLSGVADASGREEPGRGIDAAMASRFAWPTIWYDQGSWSDELREAVEDVLWEASYYPENMALLQSALEERAGAEAAGAYYREIAEVAWRNHAPMIIRQMGWDVLGYMLTPVIFQLQLRGEAYDSYTGRNYEIMRGNEPALTRNYVNYGCWWFLAAFVLSLLSFLFLPIMKKTAPVKEAVSVKKSVMICIVCSGILVGLLTLRGAGLMDYKYTALISQLWTLPALFHAHDRGVIGKCLRG